MFECTYTCVLFSKHTLYILYTFNFSLNLHLEKKNNIIFVISMKHLKKKTRIGSNYTCDTELDKHLRKCMDGHACTDP